MADKDHPHVYRCSKCDVNYPTYKEHLKCEVCGNDTWETTWKDGFDDDWREKVQALQFSTPRPTYMGELPDVHVTIMRHEGKLWVTHQSLINEGYRYLEDFGIVKIDGEFYELQGHVGKEQGLIAGGAWWIEPVPVEGAFDKLPVLSDLQYAELEEARGLRK